jgi:sporulation protein YqfC
MGLGDWFHHRLMTTFDLPPEVMLNVPLIMMVGGRSLILENHRGILEYSRERIRIRLLKGELTLLGRNMLIQSISDEELQIKGEITGILMGEVTGT